MKEQDKSINIWSLCMRSQVCRPFEDDSNRFHFLDSGKFVKHSDHLAQIKQAKIDAINEAGALITKEYDLNAGSHIHKILFDLKTEIGEDDDRYLSEDWKLEQQLDQGLDDE